MLPSEIVNLSMGFRSPNKSLIKPKLCTQAYKSHRSQCCGVKPIDTHCKTVAVMVSYDTILHVCELGGDEVCREFFSEPNSSPHEMSGS